jgi:imidazolonepropionase
VEEALTAVTYNSAHAVGAGDRLGQLKVGRQADFLICDVFSLEEIPYNMAWNPVHMAFKNGAAVYCRSGE